MQSHFKGIIIEESLSNPSLLKEVTVTATDIEPVTEQHQTPWVKQWTMHTVEIPADQVSDVAEKISHTLDKDHNWYADFKTDTEHFVIYTDKVFHITDRSDKNQYDQATAYGISIGIPDYQVDFSPHYTQWER